jgi:DNA-binding NarL/FixJ family response regulator
MSIRVIIADDHSVVRDGLRLYLEQSDHNIDVVGEATNGADLLTLASSVHADVYILDITMPKLNGVEATRELVRRDPSARVIILSLHDSGSLVQKSLRAGARGYLTKETATRCIVDAIRAVHEGQTYVSSDVTQHLVQPLLKGMRAAEALAGDRLLTPAETRVVQLVAEGLSSKEAAASLHVSVNTIKKHRTNAMAKLGIHDTAGLVRYALREGIAKP